MTYQEHKECIDACLQCAVVSQYCATEDLKETRQDMKDCVQINMECAAACYAAAQLMSLGSTKARDFCRLCADICDLCAKECEKHDNEHCRKCAEACKKCAEMCRKM